METILERDIDTPEEMRALAAELFQTRLSLFPSSIVLLEGELGAGKTTLCQGFKNILGIEDIINSPSFNLLNIHEGAYGDLWHYDLYRLQTVEDVIEAGFLEYWQERPEKGAKPRIHAIEWWRRAESLFPIETPTFYISIHYRVDAPNPQRKVSISLL